MTTTRTIQISVHAVERFRERVRPGLTFGAAEAELARVALAGEVTTDAPAWHLRSCIQLAPLYLVVADMLMPLVPHSSEPDVLVATTCLARGSGGTGPLAVGAERAATRVSRLVDCEAAALPLAVLSCDDTTSTLDHDDRARPQLRVLARRGVPWDLGLSGLARPTTKLHAARTGELLEYEGTD